MKKTSIFVAATIILMGAGSLIAGIITSRTDVRAEFNIDTGGKLMKENVEITASAAELNKMDGVTATADEINQLDSSSSTGITAAKIVDNSQSVATMWYTAPIAFQPEDYFAFSDDFFSAGYLANGAVTNIGGLTVYRGYKFAEVADHGAWLVTVTDGDGDNNESIVIADGAGGLLQATTTDKADDQLSVQMNGEHFRCNSARDLWFDCQIAVEDVSEDDVFIGIGTVDTDFIDSRPNDFMGFTISESTNVMFKQSKNGTITTNANITVAADATALRLSFFVDGSTTSSYVYVSGVAVATNAASATIPDDEDMSPAFAIETTDTGADYLQIDWIKIVNTR